MLAGVPSGAGNLDGNGSAARFAAPISVAADGSGNLYVADSLNHTVRKITADGAVTTLAGSAGLHGSTDGTGSAARFLFNFAGGLAVDGSGNVYVADWGNSTIRKIAPGGIVTTLAGLAGQYGSTDGTGSAARFGGPGGLAVDGAGNVYVADTENNTIRRITPEGIVTTLAGSAGQSGSADATGAAASFNLPRGVAVDGPGNVYVADTGNDTIRKITPEGVVTTLAGSTKQSGSADGTGAAARFYQPYGLAVDGSGNVYVADALNDTIRKITPEGLVTTLAGSAMGVGSVDGSGTAASFHDPRGITVDRDGSVYVADTENNAIRKITPAGAVTTFAGSAVKQIGSTDGTGSSASFLSPEGVAVDGVGTVYVADGDAIRKITQAGAVTTTVPCLDGELGTTSCTTAGLLGSLSSVAVDGAGNVYVADSERNTIRKVTPEGVVGTLAGTPWQVGSADGTGLAARFNGPRGLALDALGNVYVADTGNDTIRKIAPDGVVSTLAGTAGQVGSADGVGAAGSFKEPCGLAVDGSGNVYVADLANNTIRKITPAGAVSTLAGTAGQVGSIDGVGAAASFNLPVGVAVDGAGNVYVADSGSNLIRKITPAAVVTTVVGTKGEGATIAGPLPAELFRPTGVAFSQATGELFITVEGAVLEAVF